MPPPAKRPRTATSPPSPPATAEPDASDATTTTAPPANGDRIRGGAFSDIGQCQLGSDEEEEVDAEGTVWIRNRYTDEYRLVEDPEQLKAEAAAAESSAKEHDIAAALRHAKAVLTAPGAAAGGEAKAAAAAARGGSRMMLLAKRRQLKEDTAKDNENWQQYGCQEEAFRAADARNGGSGSGALWRAATEARREAEAVYVFSEEKDSGGRRRYMATTIDCSACTRRPRNLIFVDAFLRECDLGLQCGG